MKNSMFVVILATLLLAGCGSQPDQKSLATLRAECGAGDFASCAAAGLQPQVPFDDAKMATAIDMALRDAVAAGVSARTDARRRDYAQNNRLASQH